MRPRFGLVCLVLCGCPAEEEQAPRDPGPFVRDVAAAQCRKMLECCSAEELAAVFGEMEVDQTACEQAIANQAAAFFTPALRRSLTDETTRLREEHIAGCVEALEARSCGDFVPSTSANVLDLTGCDVVVEPRLTLSGFCTDDFECDTGFCSHPPADTRGTCKNPPSVGEPCLHDRCADGLRCDAVGQCAERLDDGEPCLRNVDCVSGSCEVDPAGTFLCTPAPALCAG